MFGTVCMVCMCTSCMYQLGRTLDETDRQRYTHDMRHGMLEHCCYLDANRLIAARTRLFMFYTGLLAGFVTSFWRRKTPTRVYRMPTDARVESAEIRSTTVHSSWYPIDAPGCSAFRFASPLPLQPLGHGTSGKRVIDERELYN